MAEQARVDKAPGPTFVGDVMPQTAGYTPAAGDSWCDTSSIPYQLKLWNSLTQSWTFCGYYPYEGQDGVAGYIHGYTPTNFNKLTFTTDAISTIAVTTGGGGNSSAASSSSAGYFTHVGGSYGTQISKLVFSGETISTLTSTMVQGVVYAAAIGSPLAGYAMGGADSGSALHTQIEKVLFSNDNTATVTSGLAAALYTATCIRYDAAGYRMGGQTAGGRVSSIEKLVFASEAVAAVSGTLSTVRGIPTGMYGLGKGYCAGGINGGGSVVSSIDRFVFATEVSSILASTLNTALTYSGQLSSVISGYVTGGSTDSGGSLSVSTVNKLSFVLETTSVLGAGLATARINCPGVQNLG